MRRADDAHRQHRRGRARRVGAEALAARDLGRRVEPRDARPDRLPGARLRCVDDRARRDGKHRLDDLAVAGAAAEHAGERVANLGLGRLRVRAQERLGAHQHARRADAALGRAVGDESAQRRARRRRDAPTVVTERPSHWPTPTMHEHTCRRQGTVRAPQSPAWQPILVPVRPSSSRKASARRRRSPAARERGR
jgi:hypothetical protein